MKHSASKMRTKKALSQALKELMEEKPLGKISVCSITDKCGLNRKTFYYHFRDVQQLLRWTIEQDAVNTVKEYGKINSYKGAIQFAIDYISQNKTLLSAAYNAIGHNALRYFFNDDFREMVSQAIVHEENETGEKVSQDFHNFLCSFYTETLTGMIVTIFEDQGDCDVAKLSDYLNITLTTSLPSVITAASKMGM